MIPATVTLEEHTRGDKWQGIPTIGPVLINRVPPASPLARVRMQFRKRGVLGFTIDSDPGADAQAAIVNAATWEASIPEISNFVGEAGEWDWDLEFYADGETAPLTLYKGALTINNDVTR